jgi:hypothetical protein
MLMNAAVRGLTYLSSHPMMLFEAARNAARLELSIPIDLLRWAIDQRPRGKGPTRIELVEADPALGLALTVDLYGTKIDVGARVDIASIENAGESLTVTLRVSDLTVVAPKDSPAAMMIGSMDLSKPGNLMNMMPQKHGALVSAKDDTFVIDLYKIPALAKNVQLRRALAALSFVRIDHVQARNNLLVIGLDVSPTGIPAALGRARSV